MAKANRKKQRKDNSFKDNGRKVTGGYTMLEEKMKQQMEKGEYAPALETLAQIIKQKVVKPEFLYDGAYAYFMLGDYERAAAWVNNTLSYDPANIKARLLLARICLLEERSEDGLAILDFVLAHDMAVLQHKEKEEIKEMASYYTHSGAADICTKFPALASFFGIDEPSSTDMESASENEGSSGTASILQALKQKIAAAEAGEAAAPSAETQPVGAVEGIVQQSAVEPAAETEQKIQAVLQQQSTVQEKIRLLNLLAGGCFCARELAAAERFLTEALKLSIEDVTLRNMALLQQELGNQEKALQFAAQMQQTDFLLLRSLRSQ